MGFLDKAKDQVDALRDKTNLDEKAADAVDQHGDKIDQGVDRASDFVSEKTGGKYDEQLDQGADRLRDGLDSLDGQNDDFGAAGEGQGGEAGQGEGNA